MNPANWTDFFQKVVSVLIGGIGTWLAVRSFYEKRHQETLDRYAVSKQKEYAAQRDFEHLKNNQEQMKQALKMLDDELTETRADFKELKGILMVMFNKSGKSISGIFGYKESRSTSLACVYSPFSSQRLFLPTSLDACSPTRSSSSVYNPSRHRDHQGQTISKTIGSGW